MATVSVVIPTYNQAQWIGRTLEALIAQRRRPDQAVVVDDGSTDDTLKILEGYRGKVPFPFDIVEQANGGPGAARNRGIQAATGEVIAFTDSDAVARPDWLENALQRLEKEGPDCAGVEGRVEDDLFHAPSIRTHQLHNLHGGHFLTCNMLYRRQALQAVGGFRTRYREDSDLAFSLLEKGYRIVFEPSAVVDHPPREGTAWEVFHLAKKRKNDALLWSRHPDTCRQFLGSLYPPSESSVLIGEVAVVIGGLAGVNAAVIVGLAVILFGLPRVVLASLEGRQFNNRDYVTVLAIALMLPAVNFFYRTWGLWFRPPVLPVESIRQTDAGG